MENTGKRWTRILASFVSSFWFVFAVSGVGVALGAVTLSGTLISGDASSRVDSTGNLSLGTASATAVLIGSSTIQGNATIAGPAIFQNSLTQSGGLVSLASTTVTGNSTHTGAAVFQSSLTQTGGVAGLASTTITGNATTTGALAVGGALNTSSTLAVQSSADFRGAITQAGGTVSLASTTFNGRVTSTFAGLTNVSSTRLDVSGSSTIADLTVSGVFSPAITSLTGGLTITGGLTSLTSTTITGNSTHTGPAVFQNSLTQSGGLAALASTTITGNTTTTGAISIGGAVGASSTLAVQSNTDLRGTLNVASAQNNSSTLTVEATTTIRNSLTQTGGTVGLASTTITGTLNVSAAVNNSSTLTVQSNTEIRGTTTLGAGGTAITKYSCTTVTWDPPSLTTSGVPLTNSISNGFTLTGAALGDLCFASLSSATTTDPVGPMSPASLSCMITKANSSTVTLVNYSSSTLDIVSGNLKACYLN